MRLPHDCDLRGMIACAGEKVAGDTCPSPTNAETPDYDEDLISPHLSGRKRGLAYGDGP